MAGVSINIKTEEGRKVGNLVVDGLLGRLADQSPALHIAGAVGLSSIQQNFEKQGRPLRWAALSPWTLYTKPNAQILQVKGYGGGLLGSINYKANRKSVTIGTNKIYGAIHQFGGKAGRGHKVTIPARPYLMLQKEDMAEIRAELAEFLTGAKR